MIVHRQVALGMLTVVFVALAVFCYSGYIMVASLSGGDPDRRAAAYLAGTAGSLLAGLAAGIAAWRADRR